MKKFWHWLVHGEEREKETEFLPAILEVTETPPSPTGRLVMWTILILMTVVLNSLLALKETLMETLKRQYLE